MFMSIGFWIFFVVAAIFGIVVIAAAISECNTTSGKILAVVAVLMVLATILGIGYWWTNKTASGARAVKDFKSEVDNGIYREIIVTDADNNVVFEYTGKCDVEEDKQNYILFEDADGYRHIIYKSVTDRIIINEISPE